MAERRESCYSLLRLFPLVTVIKLCKNCILFALLAPAPAESPAPSEEPAVPEMPAEPPLEQPIMVEGQFSKAYFLFICHGAYIMSTASAS